MANPSNWNLSALQITNAQRTWRHPTGTASFHSGRSIIRIISFITSKPPIMVIKWFEDSSLESHSVVIIPVDGSKPNALGPVKIRLGRVAILFIPVTQRYKKDKSMTGLSFF